MAESFGVAASVVGVISLTIQIGQILVQHGLEWNHAPAEIITFRNEIENLQTVLISTKELFNNPEVRKAFEGKPSLLREQLEIQVSTSTSTNTSGPSTSTAKLVVDCEKRLVQLINEINRIEQPRKRSKTSRWNSIKLPFSSQTASVGTLSGWPRIQAALSAPGTRDAITQLCKRCATLNSMVIIDSAQLAASTHNTLLEIKEAQNEERMVREKRQLSEEESEILDWLSKEKSGEKFSDLKETLQDGTGQWLLQMNEFEEWKMGTSDSGATIFCSGIPGAGKTMITTIVVDHLSKEFENDASVAIAFLYCNYRRHQGAKATALLCILLRQLLGTPLIGIPSDLRDLYKKHKAKNTFPSFEQISRILSKTITLYSKVFILVDGLDECPLSSGIRKKLVLELQNIQKRGVKGTPPAFRAFFTSRPIPDIEENFIDSVLVEVRAKEDDIKQYIGGRLQELPAYVNADASLQKELEDTLLSAVDGMFLLVRLHIDTLIGAKSPSAFRKLLNSLPKGAEGYDHAYNEIMQRIHHSDYNLRNSAIEILSWLHGAISVFSVEDLQRALAVEVGCPEFDEYNMPTPAYIVSVCCGLVAIDEASKDVRLVHYTAQEFFDREQYRLLPRVHNLLTDVCLTYMVSDCFDPSYYLERWLDKYAINCWDYHAKQIKNQPPSEAQLSFFLDFPGRCEAVYKRKLGVNTARELELKGVHIAANYGLTELTLALLKKEMERGSNLSDSSGTTPLYWAVESGNQNLIEMIWNSGLKDSVAVTNAAHFKKYGLVRFFVDLEDIDLEASDKFGRTVLSYLAEYGNVDLFKYILVKNSTIIQDHPDQKSMKSLTIRTASTLVASKKRADPNSEDRYGRTPISYAAENGQKAMVQLLLETPGVTPDAPEIFGRTPLFYAAKESHYNVVELLLKSKRVDPDASNFQGRTPLSYAAEVDDGEVVKLLLDSGMVDPDAPDRDGRTPLSYAAELDNQDVVRILLDSGKVARISETADKKGRTPLSYAAGNGYEEVVEMLLNTDGVVLDLNRQDTTGRTPFSYAVEHGGPVITLLLSTGRLDVNLSDTLEGWSPLHYATRSQPGFSGPAVRLLLLQPNILPNIRDKRNRTPLHHAVKNGDIDMEAIEALLADPRVDPNAQDCNGWVPLHFAIPYEFELAVEALVKCERVRLDLGDVTGKTPLEFARNGLCDEITALIEQAEEKRRNDEVMDIEVDVMSSSQHSSSTLVPQQEENSTENTGTEMKGPKDEPIDETMLVNLLLGGQEASRFQSLTLAIMSLNVSQERIPLLA